MKQKWWLIYGIFQVNFLFLESLPIYSGILEVHLTLQDFQLWFMVWKHFWRLGLMSFLSHHLGLIGDDKDCTNKSIGELLHDSNKFLLPIILLHYSYVQLCWFKYVLILQKYQWKWKYKCW